MDFYLHCCFWDWGFYRTGDIVKSDGKIQLSERQRECYRAAIDELLQRIDEPAVIELGRDGLSIELDDTHMICFYEAREDKARRDVVSWLFEVAVDREVESRLAKRESG